MVDDPFYYGQIAAANSLSDVFAMGGEVMTAMNIVGFDKCHFSGEILHDILAGAKSKIKECGGVLVGGHSIDSPEMFFGLSVNGIVQDNFWANNKAQIGDLLILTKPLGMGVLTTSIKGGKLSLSEIKEAIFYMSQLNSYAVSAMREFKVNAATDVTGFGFLGHLTEMLRADISFEIYENSIPILGSARKYANLGLIPEGSYKNASFCKNYCSKEFDILLSDAQTSGGLILAIPENEAYKALKALQNIGYESAEIIGEVKARNEFGINLI